MAITGTDVIGRCVLPGRRIPWDRKQQDLKKTPWAAADELDAAFAEESSDLYLPDADDRVLAAEERDYYTMVNCFWVPGPARWETLRANAKQFDIGTRIDMVLDAIEADNPRLKGILDKRFGRAQLEPGKLGELIPGRYVGAEATDDDAEVFDDKLERLTAQLAEQMAKGAELDTVIREKLSALGYAV